MPDRIFPCLLLPGQAEAAVDFYCAVLPGARRLRTIRGGPGGPDAVLTVEFELDGRLHLALNAGPEPAPSMIVSLVAACADQAEIDRLWAALAEGGEHGRCGWLRDRFGLYWQVCPANFGELLADPERAPRVFAAMIRMGKLDIATLEAA
ncbi:VOC family protein [Amaricoccus sp.]|uniref:VOC family protein n=1 Tax=Amaricoccus sp. TaxID=1872485 RepID=UPI001B5C5581|nr:VOC family protein [Amaricoccus sp.]MBP7240908.1 VOC family protein [Amaricoccus sp.]